MCGIFKYFKRITEVKLTKTIETAAKEVKKVEEAAAEAAQAGVRRGAHDFLTDESKAKVMKCRMVLLHHGEILKGLKSFQT